MKKISVLLLSMFMMISVFTMNVFADETTGWQANCGEVKSGKGGSYIITGGTSGGGGAFNKDHVSDLLEDGIEEDVNVFVDVDGMTQAEYFEMSVSVKSSSDVYKTEQVVMVQKDGDKVYVAGNEVDGTVEITESKIYNFKWNIYKDESAYIYATVTISDLAGNVIGMLQSDKLINAESHLNAMYEEGDHLGYLWILNVHTSNGVHIYENVNPVTKYEKGDWIENAATITGEDGVYTISGSSESGVFSYKNVSKQLADGINEKLNLFINLDEMTYGELYETSVGIKDIKDEYKTEQVVMVQKTGDNTAKITANGCDNYIEVTGSRIYTFDWNFSVEDGQINCKVNVLKDGANVGIFNKSLGNAASGDHLGYVWIFNIQASGGVHVYSEMPAAPSVKFVGLNNTYYVGDEVEFEIETVNAGPQIMVKGKGVLDGTDTITLQYKEGENWVDFANGTSDFGPSTGFPLMNTSSKFKAKFVQTGEGKYTISINDAKTGEEICKTEKTIKVINRPVPTPTPTPGNTPRYKVPNTGVDGTPTNNHSLLKVSSLSLLAIGTYIAIKKKKDNK